MLIQEYQTDEVPRAVVVGGSKGIGRAIADQWARDGLDVWVLSRSRPKDAPSANFHWRETDIRDKQRVSQLLSSLANETLAAVCYSAVDYGLRRASFAEIAISEWENQLAVNATGQWITLRATLPSLELTSGVFWGISSEVVFNAGPNRAGYAASKASAHSMLQSVAEEGVFSGVSIVEALPSGMVRTPGIEQRRPADFDYTGYAAPNSFAPLAREIARSRGRDLRGKTVVVENDGSWHDIATGTLASQSKR